MTLLDTSEVVERIKERKAIHEDITVVTLVEFPRILYYKNFNGFIVFPIDEDFLLAYKLQLQLTKEGTAQTFSDLLVAAIAINRDEKLITRDKDFKNIKRVAKN